MDFEELLSKLQNPGDDGLPETIYDDLRASHTGIVESSTAALSERDASIADLTSQVESLKAKNWDLYTQVQAAGDTAPTEEPETVEGEDLTIDDLFKSEE